MRAPVGPAGPAGPAGAANLTAYATYASTTPRALTLGDAVPLDIQLGSQVGTSFAAGTAPVTISVAGVYQVDYKVAYATGTNASIFLNKNNTTIAGTEVSAVAAAGEVSGVAMIPLAAGDTLSIGTSGTAVTLAAGTNAFLSLIRIADAT